MKALPTFSNPATLGVVNPPAGYTFEWWWSPAVFEGTGGYRWRVCGPPNKRQYDKANVTFEAMLTDAQDIANAINAGGQ